MNKENREHCVLRSMTGAEVDFGADVLSTQSTSDPEVVNGINESIVCVACSWAAAKEYLKGSKGSYKEDSL